MELSLLITKFHWINMQAENPLWNVLRPAIYQGEDGLYYIGEGPTIGFASIDDTAQINKNTDERYG